MTLRSYLRLFSDQWKLIALVTVLAGGMSAFLTARAPDMYSATVTMYVSAQARSSDPIAAYQAVLLSQQKVQSYASLMDGPMLAGDVIGHLSLNMSRAQLQAEISAQANPQTVLLTGTVTDRSPRRAKAIASAVGTEFPKLIAHLERPFGHGPPAVRISVVAAPVLPKVPVAPDPPRRIGLALALGLLAGVGLAAARRSLDTSVKSPEQLADALAGRPTLGVVPRDEAARTRPVLDPVLSGGARSEAFRNIRTNLQFLDIDSPSKVLLFTSARPDEGKTTTVCNLAVTLGRAGVRVIVVECDLRRARLTDYLGLPNGAGLTDVLLGRSGVPDVAQVWGDDLFDVLGSGPLPPNPADLISSRRMSDLIERLRADYQLVLVDAPPVPVFSDTPALGPICDGAVLVARHGKARAEHLKRATEALGAVGCPILGGILTMAPRIKDAGYGYGYASCDRPAGDLAGPARSRHRRLAVPVRAGRP